MNKDKVLTILRSLGFTPENIGDEAGFSIEYEGLTIIYSVEDDDCGTISFIVPGVMKVNDENRGMVMKAMFGLLEGMKFVQPAVMFGDTVWISYQHYIGEKEPESDVIEHMIRVLAVATARFHNILDNDE